MKNASQRHLVLAGAGHAHMTLLANLGDIVAKGHKVTVIGPAPRHYYSGMGPGMLGGIYSPEDISFPVRRMVESKGGAFIEDKVTKADPQAKVLHLASGEQVSYDVVSFNTGSQVPWDIVEPGAERVFAVKPIENLWSGRQAILEIARERRVSVGVVGGGPAALEVAGNAWAAGRENNGHGCSVRIYGGRHFLKNAPAAVGKASRAILAKRGIEIVEGSYADKISTGRVSLQDGQSHEHDLIFAALGVRPRPIFAPSSIPAGEDGGLRVNRYLQSAAFPDVFGGGDCIWFEDQPLAKVGVYAVRQNPVLLHNVLAQMEDRPLRAFDPGGSYLLIYNLGEGTGVLLKNGISFKGRLAFWIKDYIDRRFIRAFTPKDG